MSTDGKSAMYVRPVSSFSVKMIALKAGVVVIYGLIATVLLLPFWTGQRTFFGCCDASVQSIAWLTKVADAARAGHLSLWDFNTFSGSTFAGELQPAPLYPVTLLLGLTGWRELELGDAFIGIHLLLSLVGMHFFLTTNGLRILPRIIGATLFTFCGFVFLHASGQVNIYAGLVLLPFIAAFFQRSITSVTRFGAVCNLGFASLFGTAQIYAGHLTPYIYSVYGLAFLVAVSVIADRRSLLRVVSTFATFAVGSVAMAAVPLALSYEYLKVSYRWFQGGISTFPHVVTLESWREATPLSASDWGSFIHDGQQFQTYNTTFNVTIAGLCILPALMLVRSRLLAWCLVLVAFAIFVEASSASIFTATITHDLPLLAQTRTPARAFLLYAFAASALVAIALNEIEVRLSRINPRFASAVAVIVLAVCVYELYNQAPTSGLPVTGWQEAQRYYHANPALDALAKVSAGGPLVDRFIAQPFDLVPPNVGDTRPLLNVWGHRGTAYIPFFDFIQRDWDFAHSKSFDELGTRWFISDKPRSDMRLIDQGPGFFLYERPVALSVFWTDDGGVKARAPVTDVDWSGDHVQIKLAPSDKERQLVFAQAAYPGWTVRVGGKRSTLLTNDVFLAVAVSPGATDVRFSYDPNLTFPIIISTVFILGLIYSGFISYRQDIRMKSTVQIIRSQVPE